MATGGELIAQALAEEGVEYFFNLPGNGVYPMLDPLLDHAIKYILGLHEGSVLSMADGYARAAGRLPFANFYMAPGTANALSALYIAHRDKVPLVVSATQQTTGIIGRDAYASAPDLLGMVRQYTKWCWEVNAVERLPEALHRAYKIARTPPCGPVFLSIPVDLLPGTAERPLASPARPSAVPAFGPPPAEVVADIADRLVAAEQTLIICGKDVVTCNAVGEVEALAREIGAAVVSEPWNLLVAFPRPHELGLGDYTRAHFDRVTPTLVLGLGARLFVEAVGVEPALPLETPVINLGLDPTEMGRQQPSDLSAVCDVRLGLRAVLDACHGRVEPTARARRLSRLAEYQAELETRRAALAKEHDDDRPMSLPRLATELNHVLTPDTVLVEHATTCTPVLMDYLQQPVPRNLFGTGSSVQGWGTPASMGVQLARPNQRVLAIVGDGGFTFTCQSLWSAGRYQIPVTILVLNNHGYRSMRGSVLRVCERATAAEYDFDFEWQVGFTDVARGFGVEATRVSDPTLLAETVRAAMADDQPSLIEVVTSSNPLQWI